MLCTFGVGGVQENLKIYSPETVITLIILVGLSRDWLLLKLVTCDLLYYLVYGVHTKVLQRDRDYYR
jgi:hypothetical protein